MENWDKFFFSTLKVSAGIIVDTKNKQRWQLLESFLTGAEGHVLLGVLIESTPAYICIFNIISTCCLVYKILNTNNGSLEHNCFLSYLSSYNLSQAILCICNSCSHKNIFVFCQNIVTVIAMGLFGKSHEKNPKDMVNISPNLTPTFVIKFINKLLIIFQGSRMDI